MLRRRLLLVPVALVVVAHAKAQTWEENRRPFHAELARQCPEKHLEYVFQSAMLDFFDAYVETLPAEKRADVVRTRDAAEKAACAKVIAGAGCANGVNIDTASKLNLLPAFVKMLCAQPVKCPGSDACSDFPQS